MSILKKIFTQKDEPITSYEDFWNWFRKNEKAFYKVVKEDGNIERDFFGKLSSKLNELKDGFFYLTGMYDESTVELIFTPDGAIRNIVFVEELVACAPLLENWRFTALKPALDIKHVSIEMGGFKFNADNMSFYSNDHPDYPDEIDVTVIHDDLTEENKSAITNGIYIFLDNYLGELNFATTIDNLTAVSRREAHKELVPIGKLKDFLIWRQKEFIEKYEGLRYDTETDNYTGLEAELENGNPLIAIINRDLLDWDGKASHPWILAAELRYDGTNNKGMPDDDTYNLLNEIEDNIMDELKDSDGYLNVGRQTAEGTRAVYFACKDFRKPSKVLHQVQKNYKGKIEISFDIYKDKYWQSLSRFNSNR